jgi:hypothetical protein
MRLFQKLIIISGFISQCAYSMDIVEGKLGVVKFGSLKAMEHVFGQIVSEELNLHAKIKDKGKTYCADELKKSAFFNGLFTILPPDWQDYARILVGNHQNQFLCAITPLRNENQDFWVVFNQELINTKDYKETKLFVIRPKETDDNA